ncbi:hypothetical protein QR66_05170 [Chromobacterium piscinae]|nr:hypothetical protein QR66_05170 [Chromobacterium piscinae]
MAESPKSAVWRRGDEGAYLRESQLPLLRKQPYFPVKIATRGAERLSVASQIQIAGLDVLADHTTGSLFDLDGCSIGSRNIRLAKLPSRSRRKKTSLAMGGDCER